MNHPPYLPLPSVTQITPFTYREGETFLRIFRRLRAWIKDELLPYIDAENQSLRDYINQISVNLTNLVNKYYDDLEDVKADWDRKYQEIMDDLTGMIAVLNDAAVAQLISNSASQTRLALDNLWNFRGGDRIINGEPYGDRNMWGGAINQPGFYWNFTPATVTASNNYAFNLTSVWGEVRRYNATNRLFHMQTEILTGKSAWCRSSDGGVTWTNWEYEANAADVDAAIRSYILGQFFQIEITNDNFKVATDSALYLLRSGNTVEIVGIIECVTPGYINTVEPRVIAKLPPIGVPALVYPRFITMRQGADFFTIQINNAGELAVSNHTSDQGNLQLPMTSNWIGSTAPTTNFGKTFWKFVEGRDYQVITRNGTNAKYAALSFHGGEVEPGSSECADDLAMKLNGRFYDHDAMVTHVWNGTHVFDAMHPSSNGYDDPKALTQIANATRVIAFHGAADNYNGVAGAVSWIGGRDVELRTAIARELRAAGFLCYDNPPDFPELAGTGQTNICNMGKTKMGVQIEMSTTLRKSFFPNNDYSRAVRKSGMRSATFNNYMTAIKKAFDSVSA